MSAGEGLRAAPSPGRIDVWEVDLSGPSPPRAGECLDASERERAARFVFDRDRHRFLRAHHALRAILAGYLGTHARDVPIAVAAGGKPFLDGAFALGFNLSHSGDHGLVAVGSAPQVGVDIEELAPRARMRELAASVFTAQERRSLAAASDEALAAPFLTCWTRKEACLKALGTGLATDPRTVHVGVEGDRRRIRVADPPPERFLDVATILLDSRRVASLAVEAGFEQARILRWAG